MIIWHNSLAFKKAGSLILIKEKILLLALNTIHKKTLYPSCYESFSSVKLKQGQLKLSSLQLREINRPVEIVGISEILVHVLVPLKFVGLPFLHGLLPVILLKAHCFVMPVELIGELPQVGIFTQEQPAPNHNFQNLLPFTENGSNSYDVYRCPRDAVTTEQTSSSLIAYQH